MSPLPAGPYRPTSELVAVAWLRTLLVEVSPFDEATLGRIVGTGLPQDTTKWADTGFLQVSAVAGGRSPDPELPRRMPVLQLDAWATANTSGAASSIKPPWNLAAQFIEHARVATEDAQTGHYGKSIDVKANYLKARVQAAWLLTEPDRVTDDPSGYARFTADLALDWVPAPDED